jgi:hypothetical protein
MRNLTRNSVMSPVADMRQRPVVGVYGRWAAIGLLVVAPCAWAQQSPPPAGPSHEAPSPADLEPGVNTSATPPAATAPPAPTAAPAVKPAGSSKSAAPANPAVPSKPDTPAPDAKRSDDTRVAKGDGAQKGSKESNGTSRGGKAQDHLQLDTTQITGNQELPKVLYIVPWKRSDLGDLLGKPANSLLDEVLEPVDRDVFKRENRYYDALKPDAATAADKAGGAAGQTSGDKR